MAEDEEKNEDKFDFTAEGEALGYISLAQARVLAIQHARDNRDFYGRHAKSELVWEVIRTEDTEDYYEVILSYRPARHRPGIEQFTIDKVGTIEVRQILSQPVQRSSPVVLISGGVIIIAVAALGTLFGLGMITLPESAPSPVLVPGATQVFAKLNVDSTPAVTASGPVPPTPTSFSTKTLSVTKKEDTNDGVCDADCSLREAIAAAKFGYEIAIPAGTYTLSFNEGYPFDNAIQINDKQIRLSGELAQTTIIQAAKEPGAANSPVFAISSSNVSISGITIRYGKCIGAGGGIYHRMGTLTLRDSIISDNLCTGDGGGIYNVAGTLTLSSTVVARNSGVQSGGGIWNDSDSTLIVEDSNIVGNTVERGTGGGIHNAGELTLINSKVNANSADEGGGIFHKGTIFSNEGTDISGNIGGNSASCVVRDRSRCLR